MTFMDYVDALDQDLAYLLLSITFYGMAIICGIIIIYQSCTRPKIYRDSKGRFCKKPESNIDYGRDNQKD